jgi:hypothetical protein
MSDELAIEVIRLRHRLRSMVAFPGFEAHYDVHKALERFRAISESLGDADLLLEHARWRVHLSHLGHEAASGL